METYEINQDFFKKCMKAVSKDEVRYNICGVFIHDDAEGIRHYIGTNGHILVHCKEKYEGPTLMEGIIVKPTTAMGTKKCMIHVPLQVYDESTAIMHLDKRILCDIVDGKYPAYEKVIPTDENLRNEFTSDTGINLRVVKGRQAKEVDRNAYQAGDNKGKEFVIVESNMIA